MKDINILAIESSCDETAVAIVTNGCLVKSNIVSSQITIHEHFGGVVPEIASRKHLEMINLVIDEALNEAKMTWNNIDAIAVTFGPGLVGALLVGVATAKALAFALDKPLIGIHHIEGHIYANNLDEEKLSFPALGLIISGGHTNIIKLSNHGEYELIGGTKDDAVGEAFDKVARAIGLGYPGGPKIDRLAQKGDFSFIPFPIAKLDSIYDFSFSGLKSAVLNYLNKAAMKNEEINQKDIAASFQKTVVLTFEKAIEEAIKEFKPKLLFLAGGVSANSGIRVAMEALARKYSISFSAPKLAYCTDNAAMIGAAAYYKFLKKDFCDLTLNAVPQLAFSNYIIIKES